MIILIMINSQQEIDLHEACMILSSDRSLKGNQ